MKKNILKISPKLNSRRDKGRSTYIETPYKTVRDAIENLPAIAAGETYSGNDVLNHRAARLSELNLKRIQASEHDGGGRNNWTKTVTISVDMHPFSSITVIV